MGFTDGLTTVFRWAGLATGVLVVLFLVGVLNQHAHGMAAVGDGLKDIIRWGGYLLSQLIGHL